MLCSALTVYFIIKRLSVSCRVDVGVVGVGIACGGYLYGWLWAFSTLAWFATLAGAGCRLGYAWPHKQIVSACMMVMLCCCLVWLQLECRDGRFLCAVRLEP